MIPVMSTPDAVWAHRDSDPVAARHATNVLLASQPDAITLAQTRVVLAYLNYRDQRYEEAVLAVLEAQEILETDPPHPWLPRVYNTLALINYDLGEHETCGMLLDRQIRVGQVLEDLHTIAIGYHDLGAVRAVINPARGLELLQYAQTLFQASHDPVSEALTLYNMATIYQHQGEDAHAARCVEQGQYLLQAQELAEVSKYARIHLIINQAELATKTGHYSMAEQLLDEAEMIANQRYPRLLGYIDFCRGIRCVALGEDRHAIACFEAALAHLNPAGVYDLVTDCYAALMSAYERQEDYRTALSYSQQYAAIRERTFQESSEQKVRALDVLYRVEAERQRVVELQQYVAELEQLQGQLWQISIRDPLTNLHNRRYLVEEGSRLLQYAARYQSPLRLVLLDVDHFKQINDRFGHTIGDQVLQRIAAHLSSTTRASDLIARYGGEEIALLFPSTTLGEAFTLCERLRTEIAQDDWNTLTPTLQVTISIGIAQYQDEELASLLARADAQLYQAKRAGRNQTWM